jgi:hypothetical protein
MTVLSISPVLTTQILNPWMYLYYCLSFILPPVLLSISSLENSLVRGVLIIVIHPCLEALLFSIVIVAGFYLVTLSKSKSMAQYSPDHMKWIELIRVLQTAQEKPNLTEKL